MLKILILLYGNIYVSTLSSGKEVQYDITQTCSIHIHFHYMPSRAAGLQILFTAGLDTDFYAMRNKYRPFPTVRLQSAESSYVDVSSARVAVLDNLVPLLNKTPIVPNHVYQANV